jgi:glycosyltransferase involved in cell wall biosynthesis
LQHILVTRDFLPDMSGAARRCVALARRYPEPMSVSTVATREHARFDTKEDYEIERQPFGREASASFIRRRQWQRWLVSRCKGRVHVLHSGDVMTTGRLVRRAHKTLRIPYIVHISPGELERILDSAAHSRLVRRTARLVLGDAAGIVATTAHCEALAREVMAQLGISQPPPVAAMGLGTDPVLFGPGRDSGTLRQRWGIRRAPIVLTAARLLPHKGQDTGIHAIALLRDEFPDLRYVLVGEGSDEARLRNLAADLNVMDRVGFAGAMRDDELPEAYATSTIYLDASRAEAGTTAEGHGISLIEAQATALPVVASDRANNRALVEDAANGIIIDPGSAESVAGAIAVLLRDEVVRNEMGMAGREAVETYLNWNRMARDTARFVRECVASG